MNDDKRIYEILEEEHALLTRLCQEFEASRDPAEQREIFQEIRRRLGAYLEAESATLYAALRRHEEARELIEDCEMEHEQLRQLADQVERAPDPQTRLQRFDGFWELLRDHLEQEEGELLPFARGLLSSSETVRLGLMFEEESERLLE